MCVCQRGRAGYIQQFELHIGCKPLVKNGIWREGNGEGVVCRCVIYFAMKVFFWCIYACKCTYIRMYIYACVSRQRFVGGCLANCHHALVYAMINEWQASSIKYIIIIVILYLSTGVALFFIIIKCVRVRTCSLSHAFLPYTGKNTHTCIHQSIHAYFIRILYACKCRRCPAMFFLAYGNAVAIVQCRKKVKKFHPHIYLSKLFWENKAPLKVVFVVLALLFCPSTYLFLNAIRTSGDDIVALVLVSVCELV